jgi:hypothetical protein
MMCALLKGFEQHNIQFSEKPKKHLRCSSAGEKYHNWLVQILIQG